MEQQAGSCGRCLPVVLLDERILTTIAVVQLLLLPVAGGQGAAAFSWHFRVATGATPTFAHRVVVKGGGIVGLLASRSAPAPLHS